MYHLRVGFLGPGLLAVLALATTADATDETPRSRAFELTYRATVRGIPAGAKALDLWLPLPQTDRNQTVHALRVDAPNPLTIGREARFGNQCVHVRVNVPKEPVAVTLVVGATRRENSGGDTALSDGERSLQLGAEPLVPLDGPVRALALEATRGLTDRRRQGPGDLREGRGGDEVRQGGDRLGPG